MTDLITFCLQGVYWTFSCKWASLSQLAQHGSAVFASVQLAALLLMPSDPDSNVKKKRRGRNEKRCTNWKNVSPRCWNTALCSSENPIKQSKVLNSKANMLLCAVGRVRHRGSDPTYPSC